MVTLSKIYTRGGDKGETSLVDGSRQKKNLPRIEAFGTVDETNALIGIARLHVSGEADAMLNRIQNELFDLGADLATPGDDFAPESQSLRIQDNQTARLEAEIDAMNAQLQPLKSFVLPGGSAASAYLHLARTVARRAERVVVAAMAEDAINPAALRYINRLSDHLFVLARLLNDTGKADVLWQPGATRTKE